MATRVAILSDTHLRGGRPLPAGAAERIAAADIAIHAGDVSDVEALEAMVALGTPLHAVHGNVDSPQVVKSLPETLSVTVEGVTFAVIHDAGQRRGRLERMCRRFPDADVVVFGHSHMPLHESGGGLHIFNPGSPTQRRRAPSHTMGIAGVDDGSLQLEIVDLQMV